MGAFAARQLRRHQAQTASAHRVRATVKQDISLELGTATLHAIVRIPSAMRAVVLFAHGSGSGRHSPRNNYVAQRLAQSGIATVLADLLTAHEEAIDILTAQLRFDIAMLSDRLRAATEWTRRHRTLGAYPIGYFGASTGAAAALVAAAGVTDLLGVVSRGGRPDLAGAALEQVLAPTLLIVGGEDRQVLALNRSALAALHCPARLEVIAGASHLFTEPGALEQVAERATAWFEHCLNAPQAPAYPAHSQCCGGDGD